MKKDWEIKKLSEVCEINIGRTPERGNSKMWDKEKKTENVWLSIADLNNAENGYIFDSTEYVSDNAVPKMKLVKANTLLMSFKLTIGRCAITKRDLFTNEAIAALPIIDKDLNLFFLKYYLENFDWAKLTEGDVKVKGKTLNKEKLKEVPVILPPLEEQKRIVKILDEKFAQLETIKVNAQTNLQNTKDLFQSVFINVFNKANTVKIATVETVCSSIVDCPHSTPKWTTEGNLCLRTTNFKPNQLDLSTKYYVSDKTYNERILRLKPQPGDIVFSREGGILGIACMIPNDIYPCLGQRMMLLRPRKETDNKFLLYYLNSPMIEKIIKSKILGAAAPHINVADVKSFPIPELSLPEQKRIVKELDILSEKVCQLQEIYTKLIANCDELKQAYLQKAFEGEL